MSRPQIFHDSNPSGLLIKINSIFEIGFDFSEIFDHKVVYAVCSSGVQMGSNHEKMEVENFVTHSL